MKGLRARIDYALKHSRVLRRLYVPLGSAAFRMLGWFVKTDPRLVLFSGHGRRYNDSPRVLFEAMRRDPRYQGMRFVWALEASDAAPIEGAEIVVADTPKYFLTALKAGYWVSCVNIERGLNFKKRTTRYLNTWHGTPLKTIGNAAGGRGDYDFSNIDLFLSAGDYEREIYLRDFGVRPEAILMSGLPRNDALYRADEAAVRAARARIGIPEGKKVILYAPTWRDSADGGAMYALKPPVDMAKWAARLGDEYLVLVRAHAYTNALMGIDFDDFVRDMSRYPEVNDLMLAADVLVSDYSAILFDYSILERAMICFGYDYEAYKAARGLYLDLNEVLPGGVLHDEDAVLERIASLDEEAERAQTRAFKRRYLTAGGDATRLCLDALLEGRR
ncbi:MAG: CDP-glycerol glycerophosphotransferase family protein [Christensenellaceae bacterium]|nr:CDP-glycerol glycerophosphotransferase family protein [Christensenellaceae bacterium]MEA5067722.1 CDP-glycerol glycerophosphotransferase family protein [Christensenellaceae bacterium]